MMAAASLAVPRMLSVRTVCRLLGRERRWVFAACRRGVWPGARMVGNAWRIPEVEVAAWLRVNVPKGTDPSRTGPKSERDK